MIGEPSDVDGECNARLFLADDYGDNTVTLRCQLQPDHDGVHREQFERGGGMVTITWVSDERKKCDHGCGQWEHSHRDNSVACSRDAPDHEDSDCAHCHPDTEAKTCAACGKTCYDEGGHRWHCQGSTGRPEDIVPCPACARGPGNSCAGPRSHPSRVDAYDALRKRIP